MEKSKLSVICGLRIVGAVLAENNVTFTFENGVVLAIYNKFELAGFGLSGVPQLIGNAVSQIYEEPETILIKLDNNWDIRIDMRDEFYTGPEAMQLCVPDKPIVIWN